MDKKSLASLFNSFIVLLVLIMMLVITDFALGDGVTTYPWPSFRHDLLNTAAAPDSGYPTVNTALWSVNRSDRPDQPGTPAAAGGPLVVDQGMVFTTGRGIVQANDQFTGNLLWSRAFPWKVTYEEPADAPTDWCYNDIIKSLSNTGKCYVENMDDCPSWCFECTTEKPDCSETSLVNPLPLGEGFAQFIAGPTLDTENNNIIFGTFDGRVISLNMNTGETNWERTPHKDPGGPNFDPPWYDYRFAWHLSPPSIDNGKVVIGSFLPSFYYIFRGLPFGTPRIGFEYNNYWIGRDGSFYCLDENNGDIIWRAALLATG